MGDDMNNKGFTLVEVLAVIAILAIVGIITTPGILRALNSGKSSSNGVLYSNIKTGLQTMYEEIEYGGSSIFQYDENGKVEPVSLVKITDNVIETNIQTLVGNGFLSGINNEDISNNLNSKVVLNSNNEDIGMCEVVIKKIKEGNKVNYKFEGSSIQGCPTTRDFEGDN